MGSFGGNWPNTQDWLVQAWDADVETGCSFGYASNVIVGSNPPFTVAMFLSMFPKFGGSPMLLSGVITNGSAEVTGIETTAGILPGMVVSPAIPLNGNLLPGCFADGTTVLSVDSQTQLTMSAPALVDGLNVAIYNQPFVPLVMINLYIALAQSSVFQARWQQAWQLAIGLYVAHFCTLYLRTEGGTFSSAAQVASSGLARGIQVAKAAAGVSVGIQPVTSGGLESWGHWQSTEYGVQFATMARTIGSGPLLIW